MNRAHPGREWKKDENGEGLKRGKPGSAEPGVMFHIRKNHCKFILAGTTSHIQVLRNPGRNLQEHFLNLVGALFQRLPDLSHFLFTDFFRA